jgi:hypothetical protein
VPGDVKPLSKRAEAIIRTRRSPVPRWNPWTYTEADVRNIGALGPAYG